MTVSAMKTIFVDFNRSLGPPINGVWLFRSYLKYLNGIEDGEIFLATDYEEQAPCVIENRERCIIRTVGECTWAGFDGESFDPHFWEVM